MQGIDEARVGAWLDANVEGATGPYGYELIAGGRSNLTFRVTDANGMRMVLRRPPLGHVLATAHDMAREHRIISAVGSTGVPVPRCLGLCTDEEVNGAPFYV
ncbi:MAG: phosphotransferase family protein, partial [Actinobacteria bacterium]|nr:phosphotransferase family protein [Actinomycetota bacterium]